MPPDPPDQPQIAPELVGVGEQTRRRLAGLHFRAKRRRPSGERPPLPIELRRSGVIWLIVAAAAPSSFAS